MTDMTYADAPFAIRADIVAAHAATWDRIASPGTWFDGETRVAIAAETRNARDCVLCAERKEALSPYSVGGSHDSLGDLPENIVEVIHRIVSDPGRLMQKWYEDSLASGLTEEEYVEIVGVTCSTISVDTFAHAAGLGLSLHLIAIDHPAAVGIGAGGSTALHRALALLAGPAHDLEAAVPIGITRAITQLRKHLDASAIVGQLPVR